MNRTKNLIVILASLLSVAQASCLEIYKKQHVNPDYQDMAAIVASSTTIGALTVSGGEIALGLSTTSALGLLHPDSAIKDLTISGMIVGGISTTVGNASYGASSTSAAALVGMIDNKDFRDQIKILQDAQLAPMIIGNDLLELTEMINDRYNNNLSAEEVANEIRIADQRLEFCMDERNLMTTEQIAEYINNSLKK